MHRWALYETQPSFILGFHGCDKHIGEAILSGATKHLKPSHNEFDWLGHGIYFWESNPQRALDFANERANGGHNSKGDITAPFVIGAIIDLGRCLNLTDSSALQQLSDSYEVLSVAFDEVGKPLPSNGNPLLQRKLDCAVIEMLHSLRKSGEHPDYDTVRGVFWEGDDLYPGAGFKAKDHIQVCVRDTACIKGYFRPIELAA